MAGPGKKPKMTNVPGYTGPERRSGIDRRQNKLPFPLVKVKYGLTIDRRSGKDRRKSQPKK